MLSPQARRLAGELADAIEQADTPRVVALVDGCDLSRVERLEVCTELDRPTDLVIRFDRWDRAYTVAA